MHHQDLVLKKTLVKGTLLRIISFYEKLPTFTKRSETLSKTL